MPLKYLNRYKTGNFIKQENGFLNVCNRIKCRELFIGRKNKKYCSSICKIRVNNDKQIKRKESISKDIAEYSTNQRVLEKLHSSKEQPTKVENKILYQNGFTDNGISTEMKFKNYEGKWHGYGNYALQHNNNQYS